MERRHLFGCMLDMLGVTVRCVIIYGIVSLVLRCPVGTVTASPWLTRNRTVALRDAHETAPGSFEISMGRYG